MNGLRASVPWIEGHVANGSPDALHVGADQHTIGSGRLNGGENVALW